MLTGFKQFLVETQAQQEAKDTIKLLPKAHQALVKGYTFKFEGGCTLSGTKDNIGMIHLNDDKKKQIHVAAPWNYGRQFAMLHEIGHLVYEKHVAHNNKLKAQWQKIVNKTKNKLNQSAEELWCHNYANHFTKNKVVIHTHPEWEKYLNEFIRSHS